MKSKIKKAASRFFDWITDGSKLEILVGVYVFGSVLISFYFFKTGWAILVLVALWALPLFGAWRLQAYGEKMVRDAQKPVNEPKKITDGRARK